MNGGEIKEAFAAIRLLTPEYAHSLIGTLENRLILAESLLSLHERLNNISAPGELTGAAGVPFPPDPTDAATSAGAGAENVIPIGHSVRVPVDPADAYPLGDYKHPDAGRIA